uniref:3-keto-disaccharide hydrolase n=1 Tax=Algoriphagus sp. TaxID=1872435 RepID=UPI0040476E92
MKLKATCFALLVLFSTSAFGQTENWKSLFNGKDLTGWKPVAGKATFEVKDGIIEGTAVFGTGNTFLVTEEEYTDFILEVDLMISHISSNSGIMARGQYDPNARKGQGLVFGYQIEADPSPRAWSGGIYDEARRGWFFPLDLNPAAKSAFKLGEWNRYRIEAIGNTLKTWVNGQEVAYFMDDMDAKGLIGLQVHSIGKKEDEGRKTYFKNVRIQTENLTPLPFKSPVFVVSTLKNELSPEEKAQGWKLLFDGKTNQGWVGAYKNTFPEKGWTITDGILKIEKSDGSESTNFGDIVTTEEFTAFDLAFDFNITEGANSGVKYFVTLSEGNKGSAIGLEYQILDDALHPDAKMGRDGNRTLSSLYDLIKAEKQSRFVRKPGDWNQGRVVVYPDNKVEHYLNGVKVLEYQRGSQAYRDLVAISKYAVWKQFGEAKQGRILLQDHGDEVRYRNIKIKSLTN